MAMLHSLSQKLTKTIIKVGMACSPVEGPTPGRQADWGFTGRPSINNEHRKKHLTAVLHVWSNGTCTKELSQPCPGWIKESKGRPSEQSHVAAIVPTGLEDDPRETVAREVDSVDEDIEGMMATMHGISGGDKTQPLGATICTEVL